MLTPQEVSERAFQRAGFGGGYNMAQVDEFLDILTGDYTALFNENAVLKSKMKVLVEKVEEYRSTEDSMRKALLTAQRMADELVKEAEEKKAAIIRDAEQDVLTRRDDLARSVEAEELRLKQAQQATAEFVQKVTALQAEETQLLARLQNLVPDAPAAPVDPVDQTASEIDDNVQRLLAKAMQDASVDVSLPPSAPSEETPESGDRSPLSDTARFLASPHFTQESIQEEPVAQTPFTVPASDSGDDPADATARHHIDFGRLQFGRDYEIK